MISNRSDASCRKFNRRPGSQKNGCSRHAAVSGLQAKQISNEILVR
jgi:hypothetical protein